MKNLILTLVLIVCCLRIKAQDTIYWCDYDTLGIVTTDERLG